VVPQLAGGRVEGDEHLPVLAAERVTGGRHGLADVLQGVLVVLQVGREPALVADGRAQLGLCRIFFSAW
jgi:hypothetical protein